MKVKNDFEWLFEAIELAGIIGSKTAEDIKFKW